MQQILVVDIGTAQVKTFAVETADGSFTVCGHGSAPAEGLKKGEITDPVRLASSIRQAVASVGPQESARFDHAVVGVGGMRMRSQLALGSLSLPHGQVCPEDIAHAREAAALSGIDDTEEALHIAVRQYRLDGCAVDGVPLGKSGALLECECSLIAISKEMAVRLREVLQAVELGDVEIVANIFAESEALRSASGEQSYLLIDIGAGHTDVIVYENGNLVKGGSLPVGGDYVTHDIMQGIEIDFAHAERLKCFFGKLDPNLRGQGVILDLSDENIQDKNVQYDFLYDIIDSRVQELVNIVYDYLSIDLIDREIKRIYLTGGSSVLYNFKDSLQSKMAMEEGAFDFTEEAEAYHSPANAALCGLAKYACAENHSPESMRDCGKMEADSSVFGKIKRLFHF